MLDASEENETGPEAVKESGGEPGEEPVPARDPSLPPVETVNDATASEAQATATTHAE